MRGSLAVAAMLLLVPALPARADDGSYQGFNLECLQRDACPRLQGIVEPPPGHCAGALGGHCFPPGHILASPVGTATVTVRDDTFNPIGLFACQDNDHDLACGEAGDYLVFGCDTVLLDTAKGWRPLEPLAVYAAGPLLTRGLCNGAGFGTKGVFSHT